MLTFKNTKWIKRNYDCTNIVACQAPVAPNENYQIAEESILEGLTPLHRIGETKFYGYM